MRIRTDDQQKSEKRKKSKNVELEKDVASEKNGEPRTKEQIRRLQGGEKCGEEIFVSVNINHDIGWITLKTTVRKIGGLRPRELLTLKVIFVQIPGRRPSV